MRHGIAQRPLEKLGVAYLGGERWISEIGPERLERRVETRDLIVEGCQARRLEVA